MSSVLSLLPDEASRKQDDCTASNPPDQRQPELSAAALNRGMPSAQVQPSGVQVLAAAASDREMPDDVDPSLSHEAAGAAKAATAWPTVWPLCLLRPHVRQAPPPSMCSWRHRRQQQGTCRSRRRACKASLRACLVDRSSATMCTRLLSPSTRNARPYPWVPFLETGP